MLVSVTVERSKRQIELDLSRLAPCTLVVGSLMLEDGYELILEGPGYELDSIREYWSATPGWIQMLLPFETVNQDLPF